MQTHWLCISGYGSILAERAAYIQNVEIPSVRFEQPGTHQTWDTGGSGPGFAGLGKLIVVTNICRMCSKSLLSLLKRTLGVQSTWTQTSSGSHPPKMNACSQLDKPMLRMNI